MLQRQQSHWHSIVQQRGHTSPERDNAGLHEKLIAKIHDLEEQNHTLKESVVTKNSEVHQLRHDLEDTRSRNEEWKQNFARQTNENEKLQQESEDLLLNFKASKKRIQELERNLKVKKMELDGQIQLHQSELGKLEQMQQKQQATLIEERNKLEVEIYKKSSEYNMLKDEMEIMQADCQRAEKKLQREQKSKEEFMERNENLEDEVYRLTSEYKNILGNKNSLEWELVNTKAEGDVEYKFRGEIIESFIQLERAFHLFNEILPP